MPNVPDAATLELLRQLPFSIVLALILLYFIRTNRQDRHELNAVTTIQSENTRRLIDRTEQFEDNLADVTGKVNALVDSVTVLTNLNRTMVARVEQTAERTQHIRSREEAKLDQTEMLDKAGIMVKDATTPILDAVKVHLGEKDLTARKLDTIHQGITSQALDIQRIGTTVESNTEVLKAIPPHLDALKVKMESMPRIVGEEYGALVRERNQLKADLLLEREKTAALRAKLVELEAKLYKENADAKQHLGEDQGSSTSNPPLAASGTDPGPTGKGTDGSPNSGVDLVQPNPDHPMANTTLG